MTSPDAALSGAVAPLSDTRFPTVCHRYDPNVATLQYTSAGWLASHQLDRQQPPRAPRRPARSISSLASGPAPNTASLFEHNEDRVENNSTFRPQPRFWVAGATLYTIPGTAIIHQRVDYGTTLQPASTAARDAPRYATHATLGFANGRTTTTVLRATYLRQPVGDVQPEPGPHLLRLMLDDVTARNSMKNAGTIRLRSTAWSRARSSARRRKIAGGIRSRHRTRPVRHALLPVEPARDPSSLPHWGSSAKCHQHLLQLTRRPRQPRGETVRHLGPSFGWS